MTLNQLKYVIAISRENSLNEAAKKLYISQPSLTAALHSLEQELGFTIFTRSKSGVSLTVKGAEFLGYAKSVTEQYDLLDAKYISKTSVKKSFHVSMQHYTFAVKAFVELISQHDRQYGLDGYELEIHETKTHEVIDNVKYGKSEIGVLYLNDYNKAVLQKVFREEGLEFTPLFECGIYVYMSKKNPLADRKEITIKDLDEYPCLVFAQGDYNSFYYAEEVLSTYEYKKLIRASDRATLLNLMVGINGYTLCSGIICEELNGSDYCAVKLKTDERMTIGYIARKAAVISEIGRKYIEILSKYKEMVLE